MPTFGELRCNQLATCSLVAVLVTLPSFTHAIDDLPPSFDEVISLLELDPQLKQRAMAGEIVMVERTDSMDRELATALVAVIKRPYDEVIDAVPPENSRGAQVPVHHAKADAWSIE